MAQVCKICTSDKRLRIDQEIVSGRSLRSIAAEYNLAYDSLYRHSKDHLTRQLQKAWEIKSLHEDNQLLKKIESIISRAEDIFTRNYEAGKDLTALKSLDSIRSTIELLSKISYQAHQARLAEYELERQQNQSDDSKDTWGYIDSLSILTDSELNLFTQLLRKIKSGNKNEVIRKTPENFTFDDFTDIASPQDSLMGENPPERTGMRHNRHVNIVRTK